MKPPPPLLRDNAYVAAPTASPDRWAADPTGINPMNAFATSRHTKPRRARDAGRFSTNKT